MNGVYDLSTANMEAFLHAQAIREEYPASKCNFRGDLESKGYTPFCFYDGDALDVGFGRGD